MNIKINRKSNRLTTDLTTEMRAKLDELAEQIRGHQPLVAFTGAGISTDSGIPDYRGKQGLWTTGKAQPVSYEDFMSDPEAQRHWWQSLRERLSQERANEPNSGHRALARLEQAGLLSDTITQNIDGLHQDAGMAPEHVIELHGNTRTIRCTNCGTVWPTADFLAQYGGGDEPPPCPVCGGVVKNGTIAFGQPLPQDELRRAFEVASKAGVMLVVGSTLLVNPAAQVPALAKANGAYLAIINIGETALDDYADTRLEAGAGDTLPYLTEAVLRPST